MIKRICAILISAISLFTLCGCRLAVSGKEVKSSTDALCGMFITFKPIHPEEMYTDTITLSAAGDGEPIYAERTTDEKYDFGGIEGISLLNVYVAGDGGQGGYWEAYSNGDIEVSVSQNPTDSGENSKKIEGTLYVHITPQLYNEDGDCMYYCNPVYEKPGGEVYMLSATFCNYIDSAGDELEDGVGSSEIITGNLGTTSINGRTTLKIDGKEESRACEASVTIIGINDIQKYVFKEMNAKDELINSTVITKYGIPDAVTLKDGTSYAILEEYSIDKNGKTVIERSVVDMSMEYFTVRFPGDIGIAKKYDITMNNRPE